MRRIIVVLDVESADERFDFAFHASILRNVLETLLMKALRKYDYRFKVVSVARIDEEA